MYKIYVGEFGNEQGHLVGSSKSLGGVGMMDRSEYLEENYETLEEAIEAKATEIAYSAAKKYMEEHDPDCSWREAFAKTGNQKYFDRYFD